MISRLLIMSPEDPRTLPIAKNMVKFYNQQNKKNQNDQTHYHDEMIFKDGCFAEFKGTCVTFYGHSDARLLSSFTSEAFLQELIRLKFPFSQIKVIEFYGCEIGFIQEKTSYAMRFAEALYQLDGKTDPQTKQLLQTKKIQIRALNNLVTPKQLKVMQIKAFKDGSVHLAGITHENFAAYQTECAPKEAKLVEELNSCKKFKAKAVDSLNSIIQLPRLLKPSDRESLDKLLEELKTPLSTLKESLKYYSFDPQIKNRMHAEIRTLEYTLNTLAKNIPLATAAKKVSDALIETRDSILYHMGEVYGNIYSRYADLSNKFKENFADWPDFRTAIYSSDKFLLTHETLPKLLNFDNARWLAWGMIQDKIKEEQLKSQKPGLFGKRQSKLLPKLLELQNIIFDSKNSIGDIINLSLKENIFSVGQVKLILDLKQDALVSEKMEHQSKSTSALI